MKTTAAQAKAIVAMTIGMRVSLPREVAAVTAGATMGIVVCNDARTVSGWRDGGQVQIRWNDGIVAWEPALGLRDANGALFA